MSTDPHNDWGLTDIRVLQDKINADIAACAASYVRPHGPPRDESFVWMFPTVWTARSAGGSMQQIHWRDPDSLTLEAKRINIETLEIFTGQRILPLCERPIPAEGTE